MRIFAAVVLALLLTVRGEAQQPSSGKPTIAGSSNPQNASLKIDLEVLSDKNGADFGPYLAKVLGQIRTTWYRSASANIPKSGTSTIEFILSKDGAIGDSEIALSAGDELLDRAALDAIKSAAPFPEFPSAFEGGSVSLRGTFMFNPISMFNPTSPPPSLPGTLSGMAPATLTEQAARAVAARGNSVTSGNLEVLSDTQGVDFGPYLSKVVEAVRRNWYTLIPEEAKRPELKSGNVSIEFAILRDGHVAAMKVTHPSGDIGLDRAAWGGITASAPFAPLPEQFRGPYLALRFRFQYNPKKTAPNDPTKNEAH